MNKPNQYPITIERVSPARTGPTRPRKRKTNASLPASRKPATAWHPEEPANILSPAGLDAVLAYNADRGRLPEADRVKILLSVYAGLRASEISQLRMTDVTDARGIVGDLIRVRRTKFGPARAVPMHPELYWAILAFRSALPGIAQFAVTRLDSTIQVQSLSSLTAWFHWMYKQVGLQGFSSYAGRRTYLHRGGLA